MTIQSSIEAPARPADPCGRTGCTEPAVAHWSRRPTPAELDALPAELHDGSRTLVYACGTHTITLDLAAHIHQATCTAPNSPSLPACDCTPEPLPAPPAPDVTTLASGWQITT